MKESSNEHNAKYNKSVSHTYPEDLIRVILELREAIRIHDRRARIGTIASVIGATLGIAAIIFTTIVAVNTTQQFRAVGRQLNSVANLLDSVTNRLDNVVAQLNNIGERLEQLERRMTISEVSAQLVSNISDLYIENYEREAAEAGYVEVTSQTRRYQINQVGRELIVKLNPKLKDKIIDEFVKSETTAEMVLNLHPEYLYELMKAYNRLNDPDISLRILIGVISAYAHSN